MLAIDVLMDRWGWVFNKSEIHRAYVQTHTHTLARTYWFGQHEHVTHAKSKVRQNYSNLEKRRHNDSGLSHNVMFLKQYTNRIDFCSISLNW